MMGEGLDRDKLNAMLRDGTIALKLQENFKIFGAPVDLARWTQVGFDFREPITADVAVNKSIFNAAPCMSCWPSWSGSLATRWHRVSTACRCPWLTGLRRTGSYTRRRLHPTRHPPHRSACLLQHRSPLHSTASAFFCLVFFVLLHPSVTHNLKASLIFRKRSEPEPTPSPDPAAPQAARDLASRRYSHSRRVQARRLIDFIQMGLHTCRCGCIRCH